MSTTAFTPSYFAVIASIALKIVALVLRSFAYMPRIVAAGFFILPVFIILITLTHNTVNIFGIILAVLIMLAFAPLMVAQGTTDINSQLSSQDIILCITAWLTIFAVIDIIITFIRRKPVQPIQSTRPNKRWTIAYIAVWSLTAICIFVTNPNDILSAILVPLVFGVVGLGSYTIASTIGIIASKLVLLGERMINPPQSK